MNDMGQGLGQMFAPFGDPAQKRQPGQMGAGPQTAIQVQNLRMPRAFGAGAGAPQALLSGLGAAGMPAQGTSNPLLDAILRAVMGNYGPPHQAPQPAMGGQAPTGGGSHLIPAMGGPSPMPSPMGGFHAPTPQVHYQPTPKLPGGTAGPSPAPLGGPSGGLRGAMANTRTRIPL